MGQARHRGSFEERRRAAVEAGRVKRTDRAFRREPEGEALERHNADQWQALFRSAFGSAPKLQTDGHQVFMHPDG